MGKTSAGTKGAAAPRISNPWGKMRPKENPYAIYRAGGWEWRVLKAYQNPAKELNNRFARWYCFVTTPMCPAGEYGDTYVNEVLAHGVKVEMDSPRATCQSYAAEVIADGSGEWVGNALRFATREAALEYAKDLHSRWTAVREFRVVESSDPVNR